MKTKEESLTFDGLVDGCCEIILRELMCGKFRSGVRMAIDWAWRWAKDYFQRSLKEKHCCPICNRKIKSKIKK